MFHVHNADESWIIWICYMYTFQLLITLALIKKGLSFIKNPKIKDLFQKSMSKTGGIKVVFWQILTSFLPQFEKF